MAPFPTATQQQKMANEDSVFQGLLLSGCDAARLESSQGVMLNCYQHLVENLV